MFIGYGYGYPLSTLQGGGLSASAWAAFNARAAADPSGAALAAEAAVSNCLFGRFATIYNF